jgi:hypothetical protein
LTRYELRERNAGQDKIVVLMPRICLDCGHVWEPIPSRGWCYVVALIGAIGALAGVVWAAFALWYVVAAVMGEPLGATTFKTWTRVFAFAVVGLVLASGGAAMARKYFRLACEQATNATESGPGSDADSA